MKRCHEPFTVVELKDASARTPLSSPFIALYVFPCRKKNFIAHVHLDRVNRPSSSSGEQSFNFESADSINHTFSEYFHFLFERLQISRCCFSRTIILDSIELSNRSMRISPVYPTRVDTWPARALARVARLEREGGSETGES